MTGHAECRPRLKECGPSGEARNEAGGSAVGDDSSVGRESGGNLFTDRVSKEVGGHCM